jgi:hypothetical protein
MPMRSPWWRAGAAGVTVVALVAGGAPAHAEPMTPEVGECYDLDPEVLATGGWWPEADPVDCLLPHDFEVTEVGPVPPDADILGFVAGECSALSTWATLGINLPVSGIVRAPLRVTARSFGIRGIPGSYVCGAVAIRYLGESEAVAVPLRASIRELPRRARLALRHCADASDGRGPLEAPVTVRCSRRPSWLVTSWITWKAFFDDYPGRAAMSLRAEQLCGPGQEFSLPSRADWVAGLPMTWCYRLRA